MSTTDPFIALAAASSESWFVLAVGGGVALVAALALARRARSVGWQRTIWRTALATLLGLVAVELSGAGRALVDTISVDTFSADAIPVDTLSVEGPILADWPDPPSESFAAADPSSIVSALRPPVRSPRGSVPHVAPYDVPWCDASVASIAAESTASPSRPISLWPGGLWLCGLWLCGAIVLGLRLCIRELRLGRFRRRCRAVSDSRLQMRADSLARRLGLRRDVLLVTSDEIDVPVAFGVCRATVVLPADFEQRFESPAQDAVLAHELAHLAARDPLWQRLADAATALLWWHPCAWFARRRLAEASEAAADEASVVVPRGPELLAECLVAIGRRLSRRRRLAWLAADGGFRSGLGRRVERLLALGHDRRPATRHGMQRGAAVALATLLIFSVITCTARARSRATLDTGDTTMNVLTRSWRQSLAASALAIVLTAAPDAPADETPLSDGDRLLAFALDDDERGEEGEEREARRDDERRDREREGERERDRAHGEREEGERHEAAERMRDLQHHAQQLRQRLGEFDSEASDGFKETMAELREVEREMVELRRHLHGDRDEQIQRRIREAEQLQLREKLELLKREHEELREAGREEEAEEVRRHIGELTRHHRHRVAERGVREAEAGAVRERLEELKHKYEELREAGREEEAARVKEHAEELMRHVRQRDAERGDRPGGDVERRMHHIRVAAENLRAAGLNDQAERLIHEAERLAHGHRGDRPPSDRDPYVDRPPHGEHGAELERAIHEMRGQMERMHREMAEMQQALRRLAERERE